jgi:hypothetical protein
MLYGTSACNSGEKKDENAHLKELMISPGLIQMSANAAPASPKPDAALNMNASNRRQAAEKSSSQQQE